ncbi:SAM-dependent methyltransferase [Halochromatium glycolicum]|uniref:SAM-dependent methyltransferase n=1 Tax=Halochromatium glycolicum TaxID=85075 RepID=A0AAJ0U1L2_9GAMM|nr:SAM-dependent methyltransferase [Halochromatium glycolicum]
MQQSNSTHPHPLTRPRGPLGEALAYLNWLFNPFQRAEAPAIYELLSTRTATERALYLNLGFWRDAEDMDAASDALADLVAEGVRLGPDDTLLDVGFGFGDQDIRWAARHEPSQIIGLNLTGFQVQIARERVREQGLEHRIDLREGSATAMALPDESVDKITALECAFHFRSRSDFLREAFRVLRPGGRIAVADIIPRGLTGSAWHRFKQRTSWALVASKFAIPRENAYPLPTYHAELKLCGYEQIRLDSIRDQVYAPLHQWLGANRAAIRRLHPVARIAATIALTRDPASVYAGLDYVLATAAKPLRLVQRQ